MAQQAANFVMESKPGTRVRLNGKDYLYFGGTSYFQLHVHSGLIEAAREACLQYGMGSATSRSISGTTPALDELEKKLAAYFNSADAVYLPSGYLSNLAGIAALKELGRCHHIFLDEASHYSLLEGALASGLPVSIFRHRDVLDLEIKLEQELQEGQIPLLASDGIFPASAGLAPVSAYMELMQKYQGSIWLDDAHGVGTLGAHGRGLREVRSIRSPSVYMGATLSKAFGSYGGFICGDEAFIQAVRQGSVMTGSSSPPHAQVAASIRGIEILQENSALRKQLWDNARYLRESLSHLGIILEDPYIPAAHGCIPIASFVYRDAVSMQDIQHKMLDQGIFIQYSTYKGVGPEGMLRIVVSSAHTKAQIVQLCEGLKKAMRQLSS